MKNKSSKGFIGTDVIISIIAIMIFSSIILALILNNSLENIKLYKQAQATIFLTETLENIGDYDYIKVADYSNEYNTEKLTESIEKNYNKCKPIEAANKNYNITINKPELLGKNDIIQKITVDIEYTIGDKTYKQTMQRTKIKE